MSCVDELRQKAVDKSCPLCRKPLPPGPEKLFDLGYLLYTKIKGAINRSRPGIAPEAPWPTLSAEQQREMDQAVALLKEAADQGCVEAQAHCGELYWFGFGVANDDQLAFVYYQKAAIQGHARAQCSLGVAYELGQGVPQSHGKAFELYNQSAASGNAHAQCNLGTCYRECRVHVCTGLAFKASLDPKHAGGDPPRTPSRTKRRRSLHPPRSKFRLFQPKNAFSSSRAFRRICIVWVNQAILA